MECRGKEEGHLLPARAGMIPAQHVGYRDALAAPRTRGDDPGCSAHYSVDRNCSPHARG